LDEQLNLLASLIFAVHVNRGYTITFAVMKWKRKEMRWQQRQQGKREWRGLQHAPMGHVAQPTAPLSSNALTLHTRTPTFPKVIKVPGPLVEHSIAFW